MGLKGSQIVVPVNVRPEILENHHLGQQGRTKLHQGARLLIFWASIAHNIDASIDACDLYQKYRPSNFEIDLHIQVQCCVPMDYIGMDIAQFDGYAMFVATDYYSNFSWMTYIVDQTSVTILEALMLIFNCHGFTINLISNR